VNYVLDTNILLIYLRDQETKKAIESNYKLFSNNNNLVISTVTLGEIKSIAKRNKWGVKKLAVVETLLNKLIVVGISFEEMIETYAEIDTFSQGKHQTKKLDLSARNMGKNDLWIASTAVVTSSKLITTDIDFQHLTGVYLDLVLVKQVSKQK